MGNQLWWEEVKRGKGVLNDVMISKVEIPPGYQMLPEPPRGRETTDPVDPTPPSSHFKYAQKAAIQAPMLPREEVKIDKFVDASMPPPGLRPVPRDSNGLELIEAVKGFVPPGTMLPDVIKLPRTVSAPITPPRPVPYPVPALNKANSYRRRSQKPSDAINGNLTLEHLVQLEEKANEQGGENVVLQWRV